MKYLLTFASLILTAQICLSQTIIKLKKEQYISVMPCKINGVPLLTTVGLSETEATISLRALVDMLDRGQIDRTDILGNGEFSNDFIVNLKKIEFAGFTLVNVKASVLKNVDEPLSLGKKAIQQIGQFAVTRSTLTIYKGNGKFDFSSDKEKDDSTEANGNSNSPIIIDYKDAPVNVAVMDKNGVPLNNLMVVFQSKKTGMVNHGFTDNNGTSSLKLPPGDSYQIIFLAPQSYVKSGVLDIPALKNSRSRYSSPFLVQLIYDPPHKVVLNDYLFQFNKYNIQPEQYKQLDTLLGYLTDVPAARIALDGYTDSLETKQLILSLNRANAVKNYLILKGIDSNRIVIRGHVFSDNSKNKDSIKPIQYRRAVVSLADSTVSK